jgi:DNA-binding MarR family transcriptional regulator
MSAVKHCARKARLLFEWTIMDSSEQPRTKFLVAGQMVVFWRILHLMIARYGNDPMGHALVVLTMVFLNERGMPPTMSQLCDATGLPKASVSRYISTQIKEGLVEEIIDPNDRRRRLLLQTDAGKAEWRWMLKQLDQIFSETAARVNQDEIDADQRKPERLLARMKATVDETVEASAKNRPPRTSES